ncbi:MAG: hypothetical protein JW725_01145 [Candidatus Babeliaceae bacterium]|nr:hypothetical protein [Candidatus Babeliaceae bacterium]
MHDKRLINSLKKEKLHAFRKKTLHPCIYRFSRCFGGIGLITVFWHNLDERTIALILAAIAISSAAIAYYGGGKLKNLWWGILYAILAFTCTALLTGVFDYSHHKLTGIIALFLAFEIFIFQLCTIFLDFKGIYWFFFIGGILGVIFISFLIMNSKHFHIKAEKA